MKKDQKIIGVESELEELTKNKKKFVKEAEEVKKTEENEENFENKKIVLKDVIDISKKFVAGEISEEEMNEFGNNITIRSYIPLLEKVATVMLICASLLSDESTPEQIMSKLYKALFFNCLLQGYANIDCGDSELQTYTNYDLLYPIFYPFIISFCKEDYETFKEMIKESISLSNFKETIAALNSINDEALENSVSANASMLNSFLNNKDIIEQLNNIAIFNDPSLSRLNSDLHVAPLSEINEKLNRK